MRVVVTLIIVGAITGVVFLASPFFADEAYAPEYSSRDAQELLTRIQELKRRAGEAIRTTQETPATTTASAEDAVVEGAGNGQEPLRRFSSEPAGTLNPDDIVVWTNRHRVEYNLPPLNYNARLAQAALTKAQDILERQYFEHTAPDGTRASDLAEQEGYEYLTIGENLALGTYSSSKDVVQAWMASPGHRENILRETFEDIGVAAIQGTYDGNRVWVAVQIFGRPVAACPQPSEELKRRIDLYRTQIEKISAYLDETRAELESAHAKNTQEYRDAVRNYNNTVEYVQELSEKLQASITEYNAQVDAYNACLTSTE